MTRTETEVANGLRFSFGVRGGAVCFFVLACAALTFASDAAQTDPSMLWAVAHGAYASARYRTALRDFTRVANDRDDDREMRVDAEIYAGLSAYRLADRATATTFWKRASRDYTSFFADRSYPSRGFREWIAGRHRVAAKTYADLVNAAGDDAIDIHAMQAGVTKPYLASLRELETGNVAASSAFAHAALARSPGFKGALFVLGLCALARGERPAARRAFLAALDSSVEAGPPGEFLYDGGFAAFDAMAFLLERD